MIKGFYWRLWVFIGNDGFLKEIIFMFVYFSAILGF